jgi:acetoin utilization deacetylase AcuC-like enzyme
LVLLPSVKTLGYFHLARVTAGFSGFLFWSLLKAATAGEVPSVIIIHDPNCVDYHRPGDPERPARISKTVPILQERHPDWKWRKLPAATDKELLRAHSREHIEHIAQAVNDFDSDTPAHPHIDTYARLAAGAAVAAARAALKGERAFSLMRPPGHHATRERAMGFCYFSNMAVAALDALENGAERVAIWDFDAHHGNGTQDIVAHNSRISFASIHQSPGYPGTGLTSFANVHNYPIPPYSGRSLHMAAIDDALQNLIRSKPDLLLVSAGFDAYSGDPITQMTLEREDFAALGRSLRSAGIPAAAILEGGYSDDLPELIDAFLTAWDA